MRKANAGLLAACLLAVATVDGAEYPMDATDLLTSSGKDNWSMTSLGPQVMLDTVMSAAIDAGDTSTSAVAYFNMMGEPGHLAVVDLESETVIKSLAIPDAQGGWGMTVASDGDLYLGSHSKGHLYRYRPGSDEVEKLAKPADHVTFIWDVVEGKPGKLYGGCYPQSTVFEYDIASGEMRDLGPAKEGEDYARSVAWDNSRERLYVGIGSHADLIEINPETGERRSILPAKYRDAAFVYSIGVANGQVIARLNPGSNAVIIDPESGEEILTMPSFASSKTSLPGPNGAVYFTGEDRLFRYDPVTKNGEDTGYAIRGEARGYAWVDSADGETRELLMATTGRNVQRYNPGTKRGRRAYIDLPKLPLHIQNIITGSDDNVYSSGYVSGQLAILDPATGERVQSGNVKQAEGMTFYNSELYLGTYPGANLSVFDTARPQGDGNPRTLFSLKEEGQDRPFGMLGVPEENKVFMGTVPGYGLLGGALAVYEPGTTEPQVHRNLIQDQGIVTFACRDGILYGGTTIHGGLGIRPTAEEARLFLWDVKEGKLITDLVPVKGKGGISGLRFGPDGNLWGWAEGALFVFDVEKREVVFAEDKVFPKSQPRHFWRGGSMTEPMNGKFYVCVFGQLYEMDIETKAMQILASSGFELIASDSNGYLYTVRKEKLYQLKPR